MSSALDRPEPRPAPAELIVLQHAEATAAWIVQRTARWPKSLRHTLTQRIENHMLDVLEAIVIARYEPRGRLARLDVANLLLERMRFLLRIVRASGGCPGAVIDGALLRLDEVGRMLHGWRATLREQGATP